MEPLTVVIDALTTQGEGIARVEGKAVFVPYTLPGETWPVRLVQQKKKYDRALPAVKTPQKAHPARVEPRCPYFGQCGGCQLQHIEYQQQQILKQQWLEETFRRIGQIDIESRPVVASPAWGYRNKVSIPVVELRGGLALAYHQAQAPNRFVAIAECPIAHPLISQAIPEFTALLNQSGIGVRPSGPKRRPAHLTMQMRHEGLAVRLDGVKIPAAKREGWVQQCFNQVEALAFLTISGPGEREDESFSRKGKEKRGVGWSAFAQVNDAVCKQLYEAIEQLPFPKRGSLLDGYCGRGVLTKRLAGSFEKVVGVEFDREAIQAARSAVNKRDFPHLRYEQRTLEGYLKDSPARFDALVLNPPRAGLSEEARERLPRLSAEAVAMISCHPAALVRDIKAFTEHGYRLDHVQPFDMFPQTYHLETTAFLLRESVPVNSD